MMKPLLLICFKPLTELLLPFLSRMEDIRPEQKYEAVGREAHKIDTGCILSGRKAIAGCIGFR